MVGRRRQLGDQDPEVLHQSLGPQDRRLERLDTHVLLGVDLVEAQ
jgi:hypothetical protein